MDEDPYEVELHGGGWKDAIGRGHLSRIVAQNPCGSVVWDKLELSEFIFSQAAAILVMQGMLLQDFFPPDVFFHYAHNPQNLHHHGPFFLLKGELSKPQDPPMRLKNVVLARVTKVPPDMPMEQLRGLLLEQVL